MNYPPKNNRLLLFLITWLSLISTLNAEESPFTIKSEGMILNVEKVIDGLGVPWGMTFLSSNELLITERSGSVFLYNIEASKKITIENPPKVLHDGQGGLLDVAVSPDYKKNGWIYFTYVKEDVGEGVTVLARAKLKKNKFIEWSDLLLSKSRTNTSYHFGSRIAFDNNGHVFFGIGDRGVRPNAQNLMNHAGSILRLNLDGSIPKDNPFIKNKSSLPEIWSYGHRNPQGLSYDFNNKCLWEIEHGPRGGDEINRIEPTVNYGWPDISYGKEYWGPFAVGEGTHRDDIAQPVKVYIPSIAPGSLMIYSGDAFPDWNGNLFSGALKLRHINRIVLNNEGKAIKEERLLKSLNERIRALVQSPQGWIYFSTDSGKIYRILPENKK
ncbi:MAG: PQQ-dependent sugar dehydrogenase [Gammaproteobacteria bacterium]|nr:PQQ-dependent sugar dehydrogenase [Gammaproteobacteria bacterium]